MYHQYFDIKTDPFAITPDPRFLYMSRGHREAMAYLVYGIARAGGFVLLTGEVGTGKTTACRSALERVSANIDIALILNPKLTPLELVASICDELQIRYPSGTTSIKVLIDRLNIHLLDAHRRRRRTVLVVDEAQNLSIEVLEQVRLLTNLETATHKLLQIVLIGQPELRELLSLPALRQLDQRITARYHLAPLTKAETTAYIVHRLTVAGFNRQIFTRGALDTVYKVTSGVPRLINTVCDRALLGAYGEQQDMVSKSTVRKAWIEVRGHPARAAPRKARAGFRYGALLSGAGLACVVLFVAWRFAPWGQITDWVARTEQDPIEEAAALPPAALPAASTPQAAASGDRQRLYFGVNEILQDPLLEIDTDTALRTLFGYWKVDYDVLGGNTACDRAQQARLRCVHRSDGNWQMLRQYNRPAIIELADRDGRLRQMVVVGLTPNTATIDLDGRRVRVPVAEIESYWNGQLLLLWRPPPINSLQLAKGYVGPDVQWLRKNINRALGVSDPPGAKTVRFDDVLHQRVMEFQRAQNLEVDGIVGWQTLLQLNTALADPSTPLIWQDQREE